MPEDRLAHCHNSATGLPADWLKRASTGRRKLARVDSLNLSSEKLDVDCVCGRSVSHTIAQWRRQPTMAYPECGATIKVDVSDVDRSIREVDRAFGKMDRQIRRLGS
jgi:hypothetical protein